MEPTAANVTSSRSHAILIVSVRQYSSDDSEVTDGKLYLIDLAGSERASQTKVGWHLIFRCDLTLGVLSMSLADFLHMTVIDNKTWP